MSLATAFFMAVGPVLPATTAQAAPGDTTDNSGLIPYDQAYFAFEVEGVLSTLKETPTWNEIEQMLDNPYAVELDPTVGGNTQGWPSYRSTLPRRRSFIYRDDSGNPCAPGSAGCTEVTLPGFVVHPLNYNYQGGEELRLLNPDFAGASWQVPYQLILVTESNTDPTLGPLGVAVYEYITRDIEVTPGEDRIEDEPAIDYNSPEKTDTPVCIVTAEAPWGPTLGPFLTPADFGTGVPEGSIICGGDPGEPGYAGFGVLLADNSSQYSTPAVPGGTTNGGDTDPADYLPKDSIIGLPLYDPARGYIAVRDPVTGAGIGGGASLLKPSLRIAEVGGTGTNPAYAVNSEANLAVDPSALAVSNENDYVRNRDMAAVLGKALFWDMQVGSDGVQACGTCHFNAGADSRTQNQLNPDHLGGDLTFQVAQPNEAVAVGDFPFHKRVDPDAVGDGLLTPGIVTSDANDVMSSMGVHFGFFDDIPSIGTFITNASGVDVLPPDTRRPDPLDPIPGFAGTTGNEFRRVEPRNTPTMIGATLNFDNFWDGRARHDFNGGSVFGASDPGTHVFVCSGVNPNEDNCQNPNQNFMATRQVIRHSSLASQAVGPPLSEFEMSLQGRNWAKIGKKLLQGSTLNTGGISYVVGNVTPLANQLVAIDDSMLGPYSNQGGSACAALPVYDRSPSWSAVGVAGTPGLCISYPALIRSAFYPQLWAARNRHLNGAPDPTDPFDGYSLTIANGPANANNTNQFSQMEANFSLLFGMSVQLYEELLIPDDSPMDRFFDQNPDGFATFGESGEPGLVLDLLNCGQINPVTGQPQTDYCFTEVGNFKRDPGLTAYVGQTGEANPGTPVPVDGTRQSGDPDPLLGLDFFLGSNFSLHNYNYRSLRCGECHAGGPLTDHTIELSNQFSFNDWVAEFAPGQPGVGLFPEPLGRSRVISGFALESEANGNAQDAVERNMADLCVVEPCVDSYGNPVPTSAHEGGPQGQALFDNGVYNIGLRPTAEDVGRGGDDPFGFPLSLSYLALQNLGGETYSPGGDDPATGFAQPGGGGIPLPNFDPAIDFTGGGLFEFSAQDQQLNPGFEEEPLNPLLPPHLAPWANNINVGDEVEIDEVFFGINTLCEQPILEGFVDNFGPFNPATTVGETFNMSRQATMSSWPNVNRVNVQGAFKAPSLRNAAFTGPFFHTGSYLTLRQVVDFYMRGGDFPLTNKDHRDFLVAVMDNEDEALGGCVDPTLATRPSVPCDQAGAVPEFTEAQKEHIVNSVVDFLVENIDERVALRRAPFDQPEIFVPVDGTAPDNTFGREGFLIDIRFLQVGATGQGGQALPVSGFLGVTTIRPGEPGYTCDSSVGPVSHYCQTVQ